MSVAMEHPSHKRFIIVVFSLVVSSIACQIDVGGPERPGVYIPSDPAQATEVAQSWSQAITGAITSGQVTVIFNEAQITGFVAQRLQSESNPLIQDPQIYLRNGQIQVFGVLERSIFKSTSLIRIEPAVDSEGQLSLKVVEVSVGPVPAPDLLMDSISAILTEALTGSIGSLATGLRITSVAIADGDMAIVGEIR